MEFKTLIKLKDEIKVSFIVTIGEKVFSKINENDERFKVIKKCLDNIESYLYETYSCKMDSAERLYLTIHITRIL